MWKSISLIFEFHISAGVTSTERNIGKQKIIFHMLSKQSGFNIVDKIILLGKNLSVPHWCVHIEGKGLEYWQTLCNSQDFIKWGDTTSLDVNLLQ